MQLPHYTLTYRYKNSPFSLLAVLRGKLEHLKFQKVLGEHDLRPH